MNYLAHLALSNGIEEILVGNMIEDFITGRIEHPRNAFLTPEIIVGVRLHREIDTFTDISPIVQSCTGIFHPVVGKYSPIVTDILFDHFLIKNWSVFYKFPLENYCEMVYNILPKYKPFYPAPLLKMVNSMVSHKWLLHYEHEWGILRAFQSVNTKIGKPHFLDAAIPVFQENYNFLDAEFLKFYPLLKNMADHFINNSLLANEQKF